MELQGKTVLITGSSQGIGAEIALLLAKEKCHIIITYLKEKKLAQGVAAKCAKFGSSTDIIRLDVTNGSSLEKSLSVLKNIDILINNAGTAIMKPFQESTAAEIEVQLRINVEGLIKITSLSFKHNLKMVINIASGAGKTAYSGMAVYCATKAAVRMFTAGLGKENKIKAYCVNPGLTATKLTNFQGKPASKVAEVVLKTIKEEYGLPNGGEVDVWEKT